MHVQLRPYQRAAVQCSFDLWDRNILNLLLVAAVGAGKTIIASTIIHQHLSQPDKRVLFLAHREELLGQTVDKLRMVNPEIIAGIEQGKNICPTNAQVMVASVATVRKLERITRWSPLQNISLIIIDECHHATSTSYLEVLHAVTKQNPNRHLLGITATPIRMDGENLSLIFDTLAFRIDMIELIDQGFLCPIRGFTIKTNTILPADLPTRDGDFDPDALAGVIDNTSRNQVIVKSYLRHGENRPAIAFVANVAHAEHLATEFRRNGVHALSVSSQIKKEERRKRIQAFQDGDLKVLTNCNVLTEGFDAPHTACVIIAKPTRSPVVYPQSIGRGLRLSPTKRDCIVIDLVDISTQNVITLPKVFNMPETLRFNGENIRQVQRTVELARVYHPEVDWEVKKQFTTQDIRQLLQPPDFFHLAETIQPDDSTDINWMPINQQYVCVIDIKANKVARVVRDDLGSWHFFLGKVHQRLGAKKQEALQAATWALLPHLTEPERTRLASKPGVKGPPTAEQVSQLVEYQIPTSQMTLTAEDAVLLLQKLDFLRYVFRLKGQFQSGRYLGQFYEMVWFFDPDYIEAVAKVNKVIADKTQPIKTLQWLRRNKPDLFELNLLPPLDELLAICMDKPSKYHAIVRKALEGSPEFFQMKTQFQAHQTKFTAKRKEEASQT